MMNKKLWNIGTVLFGWVILTQGLKQSKQLKKKKKEEKLLNFKAIEDGKFDILAKTDHLYNDSFGKEEKSFKFYLEVES